MLKLSFRYSLVVFFIAVLISLVAFENARHKNEELYLAFTEYSDAVRAEQWSKAAYGLSDGYFAANMRLLFVDAKIVIDRDSDESSKRIVGGFVGNIVIICNHEESYELLNPDAGKLVVTAWVYLAPRYRLLRGVFSYVRVADKWQIDKIHSYLLRDAGRSLGKCPG